jgi:hypothetical protein
MNSEMEVKGRIQLVFQLQDYDIGANNFNAWLVWDR